MERQFALDSMNARAQTHNTHVMAALRRGAGAVAAAASPSPSSVLPRRCWGGDEDGAIVCGDIHLVSSAWLAWCAQVGIAFQEEQCLGHQ